jgi:hypothetical protein
VCLLILGFTSTRDSARSTASLQTPVVSPSSLFELYKAGDFDAVSAGLAKVSDWNAFIKDLGRNFKGWPVVPAAVFALEVVAAELESPRDRGGAIVGTMELACDRVRTSGLSGVFVRDWHLGAMSLLQGGNQEWPLADPRVDFGLKTAHVDHVLKSLPTDPQIRFSLTLTEEQRLHWWLQRAGVEILNPRAKSQLALSARTNQRALLKELSGRYESLRSEPLVSAEATVRLAFVRKLQDQYEATLQLLREGEASTQDDWLKYIARLFRGQSLTVLGRRDDAILAFREALQLSPNAQSARLSLASMLYLQGKRAETSEIVRAVLSSSPTEDDPWFWYAYGNYRHWPRYLSTLRAAVR